jgi:hypothetical protein
MWGRGGPWGQWWDLYTRPWLFVENLNFIFMLGEDRVEDEMPEGGGKSEVGEAPLSDGCFRPKHSCGRRAAEPFLGQRSLLIVSVRDD